MFRAAYFEPYRYYISTSHDYKWDDAAMTCVQNHATIASAGSEPMHDFIVSEMDR